MQYMNPGDYISRVATSLGIDSAGLVKSQEEIQALQQQQMQQQMMQMGGDLAGKLGPQIVKGISDRAAREDQAQADTAAPTEG